MRASSTGSWAPSPSTAIKLFGTGATVGPIVDSLHNQCLLTYTTLPITIDLGSSNANGHFFCSSWAVPPLLGFAYVVLGGILPRLFENLLQRSSISSAINGKENEIPGASAVGGSKSALTRDLRNRAILAVSTTALIIKLSDFLETQRVFGDDATMNVMILVTVALIQWAWLDRTPEALLAATVTAIGGPLSELPFVGHGFWEYLNTAQDYFPLQDITFPSNSIVGKLLQTVLVGSEGTDYTQLALAKITGPCYFAVTTDAIALGRWFDSADCKKVQTE